MITAVHAAGAPLLAAGTDNGIFDLINAKTAEAQASMLTVGGLIAVVFVVWKAVAARGAIAGVIVGAVAAAVFLFIIHNVDSLEGRVNNEVNGMRATRSVVQIVSAAPDSATVARVSS